MSVLRRVIKLDYNVLGLIDSAITAGDSGNKSIAEVFDELDVLLGKDDRSQIVRRFFDCWSDAISHNYAVYNEKNVSEWASGAREIREFFLSGKSLSNRRLWQECGIVQ
jgi:hypothetical protein